MNILAFGAHPDDVEFKCGGTLSKYANRGDKITIAIATNGNIGSHRVSKEEIAKIRYEESKNAASHFGADLIWMNEDDEFLFDTEKTRLKFIDAVRQAKPDVIFTHPYHQDYNPDHDVTGYLSFIARINATIKLIETEHEPHSFVPPMFFYTPHGQAYGSYSPEYFVDITETFQNKLDSFKAHASQHGPWCRDAFGVEYEKLIIHEGQSLAAQCGTPGVEYVEAFMLCKTWPIKAEAHKLLP